MFIDNIRENRKNPGESFISRHTLVWSINIIRNNIVYIKYLRGKYITHVRYPSKGSHKEVQGDDKCQPLKKKRLSFI